MTGPPAKRPDAPGAGAVPVAVSVAASPAPAAPSGGARSLLQIRRKRRRRRSVTIIVGATGAAILAVAVSMLALLAIRSDRQQAGATTPAERRPVADPEQRPVPMDEAVAEPQDAPVPDSDLPAAEPSEPVAHEPQTPEPQTPEPAIPDPQAPEASIESAVEHAIESTPENAEMAQALAAARAALQNRQFHSAFATLAQAGQLPGSRQQHAQYVRLQLLAQYAHQFYMALDEALDRLEGGDELEFGDSMIAVVVEASRQQVTVRLRGTIHTYPTDQMPAGLAVAIVDHRLDRADPVTLVYKAAYLATLDGAPEGWQQRARQWFREAAERGVEIGDLEQVLDET